MNLSDLEISKALALAIGWEENQTIPSNATQRLYIFATKETTVTQSKCFDYRDWNVIGPIAEKFDCFPYKNSANNWVTTLGGSGRAPWPFYAADTPQKAIALAVIGSKK